MTTLDKSMLDSAKLKTQQHGKEFKIWMKETSKSLEMEIKRSAHILSEIHTLSSKALSQELI
jgi:hypothetical protein